MRTLNKVNVLSGKYSIKFLVNISIYIFKRYGFSICIKEKVL